MSAYISTSRYTNPEEITINGLEKTVYSSITVDIPFSFNFIRNSNNTLEFKSGSNTFSLPTGTQEITSPGTYVIIDPSNLD